MKPATVSGTLQLKKGVTTILDVGYIQHPLTANSVRFLFFCILGCYIPSVQSAEVSSVQSAGSITVLAIKLFVTIIF